MSCSLCRLPFTPDAQSVAPVPPPPGILTDKQYHYFTKAVGIGERVPSNVLKCEYLDQGLFGAHKGMVLTVVWKSEGGTAMMFHSVCATILRHIFNCNAPTVAYIADLCEIECVLGRPKVEPDEGRLPYVNYESAGPEKVDVRPYYAFDGSFMRMDWQRFKADGFEWTYSRPDTFPRFHKVVAESRLPGAAPEETSDALTTKPLDILHVLLPYLSDKSFVSLLSTCRTLRHQALTVFQHQARQRVLDLGWAIPLPREYASAPQSVRDKGIMVDPAGPPLASDWLLYLCNLHKSHSMRARRWIWATAQELRRVYLERKAGGPYEDVVVGEGADAKVLKSSARKKLESAIAQNPFRVMMNADW